MKCNVNENKKPSPKIMGPDSARGYIERWPETMKTEDDGLVSAPGLCPLSLPLAFAPGLCPMFLPHVFAPVVAPQFSRRSAYVRHKPLIECATQHRLE